MKRCAHSPKRIAKHADTSRASGQEALPAGSVLL